MALNANVSFREMNGEGKLKETFTRGSILPCRLGDTRHEYDVTLSLAGPADGDGNPEWVKWMDMSLDDAQRFYWTLGCCIDFIRSDLGLGPVGEAPYADKLRRLKAMTEGVERWAIRDSRL